jgi:hypothetical protein
VNNKLIRTGSRAADIEVMARSLPREALIETNLARALIDSENDRSGATLALSCLQNVMGSTDVRFVRDDDGALWPFVVDDEDDDEFWRGPLRKTSDGLIQQARFYPNEEKIVWGSPIDSE